MTADELAAKAAAIKAEWIAKAAAGDSRARRMLRDCYPEEYAELVAAKPLAQPVPPKPWCETDHEPGEEG